MVPLWYLLAQGNGEHAADKTEHSALWGPSFSRMPLPGG